MSSTLIRESPFLNYGRNSEAVLMWISFLLTFIVFLC